MNIPERSTAARGTNVRRVATLFAPALLVAALLVGGCGGGGSSDAGGTAGGTPSAGGLAGAWYYNGSGTGVRFDLVTRDEVDVSLNKNSQETFGYGAGVFADLEEQVFITARPNEYTLNLRNLAPNPFSLKRSLPTFPLASGYVTGPVQPSPDGMLFAMQTRESASLGDPFFNYVYVFDAALNITFKRVGYRAPAWLTNGQLVVAGDDGLFTMTVAASPTVSRLGPPGTPPDRPMVSPDGRVVAYMQESSVWRIGADGSGAMQLTEAAATAKWPTWSPDGSQIALVRGICGQFAGPDIVIVSATGTRQNVYQAATVLRKNGAPVRSCGPVYWLP